MPENGEAALWDPVPALGTVLAAALRAGTHDATVRHQLRLLRRALMLHDTPYAGETEEALRTYLGRVFRGAAQRAAANRAVELLAGLPDAAMDDALAVLERTNPAGYGRLRAYLLAGSFRD